MTEENKKKAGFWKTKNKTAALISLVLIFVFMAIASAFNSNGGNVTIREIYYPGTEGNIMHGMLYVPKGVSSANPAPAIVNMHGGSDYMQSVGNFSIELSRRGYVVLSINAYGSGSSDYLTGQVATAAGGAGGPSSFRMDGGAAIALEQVMSYAFVDQKNIGLIGHSMGGTYIANAALSYPDNVRAIMPWGSGSFVDMMKSTDPGEFTFNVGYISAQYDEYVIFASRLRDARDLLKDELLMNFVGTNQPINPGQVYGSFEQGTARVIYTPATSHIGNIINMTSIGSLVSFFETAMPTGTTLSPWNQVWLLKELFSVLAIISLLVFVISFASVLLDTKTFSPLVLDTPKETVRIGGMGRIFGILFAMLVPMLTLHWVGLRLATIRANRLFPMNWANYLVWVSLVNAGIILAAFLIWHFTYGKKHGGNLISYRLSGSSEKVIDWRKILFAACFSITIIFCMYFIVNLCYNMFKIDFRFWQFGIMPITLGRLGFIWGYLLSFLVIFGILNVVSIAFAGIGKDDSGKLNVIKQYALGWLIGAGGFTILLLIYYIGLRITRYPPFFLGFGPFPNGHPNSLSFSMKLVILVPTFTLTSILNTALYRKTKNIYVGWFIAALLVAMIVVTTNSFSY